ncbi:unnamed protein product [Euphydryas editha]|uniref:Uncharacterized protein n=1 Tax=Euphydryas editha TaxID=104508 RepID=A0AAU9UTX1_EUPED|nr:unnamed protein product [Euphydryas editha]
MFAPSYKIVEKRATELDTSFLHQDNAPVHQAGRTTDYLCEVGVKLLGQPPYSPDLAPRDCAFSSCEETKGRKFF